MALLAEGFLGLNQRMLEDLLEKSWESILLEDQGQGKKFSSLSEVRP